jgi:8-oxo-dGTP diphosphatase
MKEDVPHRPGKLYKLKSGLKRLSMDLNRSKTVRTTMA